MKINQLRRRIVWLILLPLAGGMWQAQATDPSAAGSGATSSPAAPAVTLPGNSGEPTAVPTADMAPPPQVPPQEMPGVLTRGPVHEAYARPVALQADAGAVAPRQPPADIQEMPPADKPQGDRYVWAPGYWSWDAGRKDFVWVSGCWRLAPPNATWVPGFWTPVAGSSRWVAGYWKSTDSGQLAYLPAPPAGFDEAPPGDPPTPDAVWVPGCWYWNNGGFIPRAGYWLRQIPGWIWEPSHYQWTPYGYVFVAGRWDYELEHRGVLFAPVEMTAALEAQPNFVYTPAEVINPDVLADNLFACPGYGSYYFGDYYDSCYPACGIFPCFACFGLCSWFDPIFCHRCFLNCGIGRDRFVAGAHARFNRLRGDASLRPSQTFAGQQARLSGQAAGEVRSPLTTSPLASTVAHPAAGTGLTFTHISNENRLALARQAMAARTAFASAPSPSAAPAWTGNRVSATTRASGGTTFSPGPVENRASAMTSLAGNIRSTSSFTSSYRPSYSTSYAPASRPSFMAARQAQYSAPTPARSFASRETFTAPATSQSVSHFSGGGGGGFSSHSGGGHHGK